VLEWEVDPDSLHASATRARSDWVYVTQDQALPNPRDEVMLSIPRQGHAMARHYLYATLIADAQVVEHELMHLASGLFAATGEQW
jgi:hypothetical protein